MKKYLLTTIISFLAITTIVSAYTVISGDTLWKIAQNSSLSLNRLIQLNPQIENPDLIYPGDEITIESQISFFDKLRQANEEMGVLGSVGFVQVQDMYLSGSGVVTTDTSIGLTEFEYSNDSDVLMVDFGDIGYGTLEPDTTREENISCGCVRDFN